MLVTVLIFAKFARNKPATLLEYELLSDVLETLNLDCSYFETALVYRTGE